MTVYTELEDLKRHLESNPATIVVFSAEWCGYCGPMKKSVQAARAKLKAKKPPEAVVFSLKEKLPSDMGLTKAPWNLRSLPTTMFFERESRRGVVVGALPVAATKEWIEGFLADDASGA